jgi:PilZ domain
MSDDLQNLEDRRGLRFPFDGDAEILVENSVRKVPARVTELSFRGCFVQISSALQERQRMKLKIRHAGESLEVSGAVMYVRQDGVAMLFDELEPEALNVLQDWILNALDMQAEAERQQEK